MKVILLLVVLLGCGAFSVLVQTFGWLTMIPTQLQETGSLTQAVSNTFDGEHPCEFCHVAERLRDLETPPPFSPNSGQEAPLTKKTGPKDLLVGRISAPLIPSPVSIFLGHRSGPEHHISSWETCPESPPPRA